MAKASVRLVERDWIGYLRICPLFANFGTDIVVNTPKYYGFLCFYMEGKAECRGGYQT